MYGGTVLTGLTVPVQDALFWKCNAMRARLGSTVQQLRPQRFGPVKGQAE